MRSSIISAAHIALHTIGDDPQSPAMIGDQGRRNCLTSRCAVDNSFAWQVFPGRKQDRTGGGRIGPGDGNLRASKIPAKGTAPADSVARPWRPNNDQS